jgi:hypothetical protein
VEKQVNSRSSEMGRVATYEDTVVRNGVSTTLSVTESGDTGVETKTVGEDVLDLVGSDGVEEAVVSSLSDDDNRLTLALVTVLSEHIGELENGWGRKEERRTRWRTLHIEVCQSSAVGGRSGMNM